MKTNQHSEIIYSEEDICDLLMQAHNIGSMKNLLVDDTVDLETAAAILENVPAFVRYDEMAANAVSREEFDHRCQTTWYMPDAYKTLDIAEYLLNLCKTDAELQRVGQELLLYQGFAYNQSKSCPFYLLRLIILFTLSKDISFALINLKST